ncbi:MAG: hypothetical protein CMP10_11975 [Zetaproteobacteria bacterium]|nr:hypothetical protein [Pseudobdellovibrionaceae bacterium]|tara:strand:+ start:269 stop:496 length:228 start_codon:yes stop_codon:yes gene_type:complete
MMTFSKSRDQQWVKFFLNKIEKQCLKIIDDGKGKHENTFELIKSAINEIEMNQQEEFKSREKEIDQSTIHGQVRN